MFNQREWSVYIDDALRTAKLEKFYNLNSHISTNLIGSNAVSMVCPPAKSSKHGVDFVC